MVLIECLVGRECGGFAVEVSALHDALYRFYLSGDNLCILGYCIAVALCGCYLFHLIVDNKFVQYAAIACCVGIVGQRTLMLLVYFYTVVCLDFVCVTVGVYAVVCVVFEFPIFVSLRVFVVQAAEC